MEYHQILRSLTPEIYRGLKRAVELGKWSDGRKLSPVQRQICLQAIITYDAQHHPEEQRVGYIHRSPHDTCGSAADTKTGARRDPGIETGPLKWK